MKINVEHLNPAGLVANPAFTQAVSVRGPHRTIYVGGQDSVDAHGDVVGINDVHAQAQQVFRNLKLALSAGGATLDHVVKWTVYMVDGVSMESAFEVFQHEWGNRRNPPAISVIFVSGLARSEFLLEIEAIAVVPE